MCSLIGFQFANQSLIAQNYDFYIPFGMLVVATPGAEKKSLTSPQASWTARYGSITLNQFGRELPTAGINDSGLAGHLLQQDDGTKYVLQQPNLNELQWLQYILDTCACIDDIEAMARRLPMQWEIYPVHYGFTDAKGQLAFVSFSVQGMKIHRPGPERPAVLTNTEYQNAYRMWHQDQCQPNASRGKSLYRFALLASAFAQVTAADETGVKQALLQSLKPLAVTSKWWDKLVFWRQPRNLTVWTCLFNPQQRRVEFFTPFSPEMKYLELTPDLLAKAKQSESGEGISNALAINTQITGGLVFDMNSPVAGDISSYLQPYKREHNAHMINLVYPPNLLNSQQRQALIQYPETYAAIP